MITETPKQIVNELLLCEPNAFAEILEAMLEYAIEGKDARDPRMGNQWIRIAGKLRLASNLVKDFPRG